MTYVEWLRVRGVLKVTAIVLGVMLVFALGLRIYMASRGDALGMVSSIQHDPGSHVSTTILPDGATRTTIDSKDGMKHVTIDDHGYAGKHIEIIDKSDRDSDDMKHAQMGPASVNVDTLPPGQGSRVTIDTNTPQPFVFFAAIAAFVALITATILGAPFARENDGHLEIALTKPVSRIVLAASTIGVDFAGIVGSWILTVIALIVGSAFFQSPNIVFDSQDLVGTMLGLVGAFAWYALLTAATASMKRSYGIVLGLAWPFALIVFVLGKADLGTQPVFVALHVAAKAISYIMPFTYLHFGPAMTLNGHPAGSAAFSAGIEGPVLAALAIGYAAIAVIQWRRVEA
jgi:hypothetical protein